MSNDYFKNLTLLGFSPIQAEHIGGGPWRSWTPTYGGGGGMEFKSVTTYLGRYRVSGWDLQVQLFAGGTTATADGTYISATLPAGLSVRVDNGAMFLCMITNGSWLIPNMIGLAGVYPGPSLRFYIDGAGSKWGIGPGRQIRLMATLELTA